MLSYLNQSAKQLLSRLSSAANQLFRRNTQLTRPNVVTDTLADLPRSRAELFADHALLRQQWIV